MWNPFAPRRIDSARLGRAGERRAAWFYRLRGYRIVAQNLRLATGEIDLVVSRGGLIVIAEVKTRQSLSAGEGHEAVNAEKRARLVKLADEYVIRSNARGIQLRYDVLSLFWNGRRFIVSHYADAFRPMSDAKQPWKWNV